MKSLRDTARMLAARLLMASNTLKRLRLLGIMQGVLLLLLGLFFITSEFWFFSRVFGLLKANEDLSPFFVRELIERLLGMVFLTGLSMLLFSSIVSAISTVFLSKDTGLLLASPVSRISIFSAKHIETSVNASYMVVTFTAPILFAYGWCFAAGPGYYVLAMVTLLLIIVAPCSAGVGITLILMRFLPAKRTQQMMLIGGLIGAVTLVMLLRLLRPEKLLNPESTDDFNRLLAGMTFPALDALPSTWATRALLAGINGQWPEAAGYLGLLAGLSVVILALLYAGAFTAFLPALARSSLTGVAVRKPGEGGDAAWRAGPFSFLGSASKSILLKDIRSFLRDTSQWSQLFLLGALVVIYLFNIKILPRDQMTLNATLTLADFISWLNMGLAGVVLCALALRFVFPSMSMEGRAIWILRSSPVRFAPVLWTRLCFHAIPLVLLAEILVFVSNILLQADRFIHALSAIVVLVMTITLTAMAEGLGATRPYFKSLNYAQIAVSARGLLFMILSLLYVGVVMAASFRPVYAHFHQRWTGEEIALSRTALYYCLILAVSLVGTVFPMVMGARQMERLED